jgi:nucleoside-diphosphate-sugar epimerase
LKVLLIGGTGVISSYISKLAINKNMELFILNRGNNKNLLPKEATLIKADISDRENLKVLLKYYTFDCVVNFIAFREEDIVKDIELFRNKTKQYIFISSASAYQKPSLNHIITESTPLINPYWQYSRDKIACEERLLKEYREKDFPITIVRPSHTYNEKSIPVAFGSSKYRWSIADRILKGKKIIVHGDGTSLWVLTHSEDFAKGFVGLIGNPKAIGHAFHITSDEVLTWNQIHEYLGNALGVKPKIVYIPSDYIENRLESKGNLLGDKAQSVLFDNSKIKSFVPEFKATIPFSEGIKRSVKWYKENEAECKIDKSWNTLVDKIINEFEK